MLPAVRADGGRKGKFSCPKLRGRDVGTPFTYNVGCVNFHAHHIDDCELAIALRVDYNVRCGGAGFCFQRSIHL